MSEAAKAERVTPGDAAGEEGFEAPKTSGFRKILRQSMIPWLKEYGHRTAIVTLLSKSTGAWPLITVASAPRRSLRSAEEGTQRQSGSRPGSRRAVLSAQSGPAGWQSFWGSRARA